jgi:hypothetical protein
MRTKECRNNLSPLVSLVVLLSQIIACNIPYKNSDIPQFNLLLEDSVTIFHSSDIPRGKKIILFYFDPDCEHCQNLTKSILTNYSSFSKAKIYLITRSPINKIISFDKYFQLSKYDNIILGKDYQYLYFENSHVSETPTLSIYNEEKKVIAILRGEAEMENLEALLK